MREPATNSEVTLALPKGQVAIDGKSLRRTYAKGCAHMPPLVVTMGEVKASTGLRICRHIEATQALPS